MSVVPVPAFSTYLTRYRGSARGFRGNGPWGFRSSSGVKPGGSSPGFQTSRRSANTIGLVFPRPTYAENGATLEQTSGKVAKASEKTSEKKRLKTSEKILNLVAVNPLITIAELSEIIGVTTRSTERNIENLQRQGRLAHIGPDKCGRWIFKDCCPLTSPILGVIESLSEYLWCQVKNPAVQALSCLLIHSLIPELHENRR